MYGETINKLWNLKSILDMEFEQIEKNKEIEELDDEIESYTQCRDKINELVRAVNKLNKESKESEEK